MDSKQKAEMLQYIIGRYDHYFDAVNNKGNVYLTLMAFLLGGSITIFYNVNEKFGCSNASWSLFYFLIFIQLAGIICSLLALSPYLKSGTRKLDTSIIYFADVASYSVDEYKKVFDSQTNETLYADLLKQSFQLSQGLKKKYNLLFICTWNIGCQIVLMIVLGLIIIK